MQWKVVIAGKTGNTLGENRFAERCQVLFSKPQGNADDLRSIFCNNRWGQLSMDSVCAQVCVRTGGKGEHSEAVVMLLGESVKASCCLVS